MFLLVVVNKDKFLCRHRSADAAQQTLLRHVAMVIWLKMLQCEANEKMMKYNYFLICF